MSNVPVDGHCEPEFARVWTQFERNFEFGEVGAGVCVYVDGRKVVDLWGGYADKAKTRPWDKDTIINVYSSTKGMTTICAHRLVERGLLDVDQPVAKYWPEFAQAGKESIPVRMLLTHQSGLPALTTRLPREQALDWDTNTSALAAQEPAWQPGTRSEYHALTFGYLVGEVVRRIDGRSLGTYFREEVAEPLGADFLIGFGPEHDDRCAEMIPAQAAQAGQAAPDMSRGVNSRAWRAAEIPAGNGHATADGLARPYAALSLDGSFSGVSVLQSDTIDHAIVEQTPRQPDGSPGPIMFRFGLGFMLFGGIPGLEQRTLFGHGGAGGSIGMADREAKIGFGYVMNQMQGGTTGGAHGWRLMLAVYRALGLVPDRPRSA